MTIAARTNGYLSRVGIDGLSPTYAPSPNNFTPVKHIAGNAQGLWVAGAGPYTSVSTNGVDWSTATYTFPDYSVAGIAVSASGTFVAVLEGGGPYNNNVRISTSTNGTSWSAPIVVSTAGVPSYTKTVTYSTALNMFVVLFWDNNIRTAVVTSTNGTTWSTPTSCFGSASAYDMSHIVCSLGGKFVMVGMETGSTVATSSSTNGTTWSTPVVFPTAITYANFQKNSLTVSPSGLFLIVGSSSSKAFSLRSSDGSNWVLQYIEPTITCSATGVAVNSMGRFLLIGQTQTNSFYATSLNGTSWGPFIYSTQPGLVAYDVAACNAKNIFVVAGNYFGTGNSSPGYAYGVWP
jgi:hypothetical protein